MANTKKLKVLLAGGGSGGHIYGLLAVAEALKARAEKLNIGLDLRYFGDADIYKPQLEGAGIHTIHISAGKLRRYVTALIIIDFLKLVWSIPQAFFKAFWFMPDVAFSKGGTGALPVLYACRFYRVPIIIHDSDAIPGLTNRVSGKFAKIIELGFASAAKYFVDQNNIKIVGNPVRSYVIPDTQSRTNEGQRAAKLALKFNPSKPLILIMGGSQGAQIINNLVLENLKELLLNFQIIHQIGFANFSGYMENFNAESNKLSNDEKDAYRSVAFLENDMRTALAAADLIISRAGAGAIYEIASAGKPSILIPITESANNHQKENAFEYETAGACVVITEENLFSNIILSEVVKILENPEKLKKMAENAKNFYKPDAADIIAKDIINLGSN